jgi:hypothetical protein
MPDGFVRCVTTGLSRLACSCDICANLTRAIDAMYRSGRLHKAVHRG